MKMKMEPTVMYDTEQAVFHALIFSPTKNNRFEPNNDHMVKICKITKIK